MMFRTVRARLTAWYTAVLAFTLLILGLGAYAGLRRSIEHTVDGELRARLRGMNEFFQNQARHPDDEPLADELREQAGLTPAGAPLRIADPSGHWLYESWATKQWGSFDLTPGIRTITAQGEAYRVLTARALPGTIQLGAPLGAFDRVLREFTWTALLASPLLVLLAAAVGYWLSGRALAPVEAITQAARNIEASDLSLRLPAGGAGDELDRLSETLNGMFMRLESAFQRITNFTADASHELRTPVAVIRTTAELARSQPRTASDYENALDGILAESERTTSLIDDLLLLARADAAGPELQFEMVDLSEILDDACREAGVLAEARGIALTLEAVPETGLSADRQALHRLFLALLDNAVKYTAPGGQIRVSVRSSATEAEIHFEDTGRGISPEDLPHIFERFYRASTDRRRDTAAGGGAGLGLSIAQWIAERHGGRITAQSTAGRGSLFAVFLPLHSRQLQNRQA